MAPTLVFWFRRKYNLPPNSPVVLDLTLEEIEAEYWAHRFYENPPSESGEDDDWDAEKIMDAMESDDWEDVINGN